MGFAILALYCGGRANSSKTEDFSLKFQRFAKPVVQSGRLLPPTAQRIQISIKSSPISSTKEISSFGGVIFEGCVLANFGIAQSPEHSLRVVFLSWISLAE
jgi:hypothetical protein